MDFKYDDLFKRIEKVKELTTSISEGELEELFPTYASIKRLRELGITESEVKATIDNIAEERPQNLRHQAAGLTVDQAYMNEGIDALNALEEEFLKPQMESSKVKNALLELMDVLDVVDTEFHDELIAGLTAICWNDSHELEKFIP